MNKSSTLHPTVEEFKNFVKKHPLLIKEVREKQKKWQSVYEEWVILGEDDPTWEKYKKTSKAHDEDPSNDVEQNQVSQESVTKVLSMLKNINIDDVQHHLAQFNGLVSNIHGIIQQFQSDKGQQHRGQENPLSFRKD